MAHSYKTDKSNALVIFPNGAYEVHAIVEKTD